MEDSEREKRTLIFNPWNDAQILTHGSSNVDRMSDFDRMKIFNAPVMPSRTYNRNPADVAGENYYNATNKTFDYLKTGNTIPSYSVNTVHLQNPYKPLQRLEGFTSRDHTKVRLMSGKFPVSFPYEKVNTAKRVYAFKNKQR